MENAQVRELPVEVPESGSAHVATVDADRADKGPTDTHSIDAEYRPSELDEFESIGRHSWRPAIGERLRCSYRRVARRRTILYGGCLRERTGNTPLA